MKTKEATKAWINGKMMLALLIEKFISSVDFPPLEKEEKTGTYLGKPGWHFC